MRYELANILLDNNERFYNYKGLYCRSSGPFLDRPEINGKTLLPYGTYIFTSYFNSFSLIKWREYTNIEDVFIHLEISGKCEITFEGVINERVGIHNEILGNAKVDSEDFSVVEFKYPETKAVLLGFRIVTLSECNIKNCYYYTEVSEEKMREVHLALSTTTFKKEPFIKKNVDLFNTDIRPHTKVKAGSIQFVIVDNGRTLSKDDVAGEGIHLFENANVGGSGGFARGMIEARRLKTKATHVLIMDDDIELSPESIKRTFNLLTFVKDEYKDAFISGAMFSMGNQAVQLEDIGHARKNGSFGSIKKRKNMNHIHEVVANELPIPMTINKYAAFWYCCIPSDMIDKHGLPLPIFIRYDDAEYGLRCAPKFMTMNGINVWHEDFDGRYSAFYEKYCAVRNSLIIQAVSNVCPEIDYFKEKVDDNFRRDLKKFNYNSAELVLDAIEDYLKGPQFIETNNCEAILKEKMKLQEKMVPLKQLGVSEVNMAEIKTSKKRNVVQRGIDALTLNGQRLTPSAMRKGRAMIMFDPNRYQGRKVKNKAELVLVDSRGEVGLLTKYDKKRFRELFSRYKRLKKQYYKTRDSLKEEYKQHRDYMYSEGFWKRYLEID